MGVKLCGYTKRDAWIEGVENFGPKSEEMAGGWRRVHSKELHQMLLG
jgi:hypothetical protein